MSPEEIAQFNDRKSKAEEVAAKLRRKVDCYVGEETRLGSRSSKAQLIVGDLSKQEKAIEEGINVALANVQSSDSKLKAVQQKLNEQAAKEEAKKREFDAAVAAYSECMKWTEGVCHFFDPAKRINFENRRAELQSILGEKDRLKQEASEAESIKRTADARHREIIRAFNDVRTEIRRLNDEIKQLKASLALIPPAKQDLSIQIERFNTISTELKDLDPSSNRRSDVRKLRSASEKLNTLLDAAQNLLNQQVSLPDGDRCAS